ncbi:16S rRNA (guanine(527)-N(7))-methyltransferase RsmG [Anaerotalea alkaliphila]|uniref:Ribosomal RNA small subunit methyltransferase G n=1 Tax=Anaerotalea alkaliphila TaxID=2662126 RepID=A0A7X5HWS6_9FIRM|nr:16S rRNA (guanine(527)-N(7))-methyltransferase RsmG [Anaerotalea alkaliphila]NDL68083.1 16S rRNA (guanine(527)-N(7))-methyltransferase RsmG [Anaerotalea alkaliphila]
MEKIRKLKKYYNNINIELTDRQAEQLLQFYSLTLEWNERMNLTAIVEEDEFFLKHFIDSSLLAGCLDMNGVESLLDLGTGAGFPGIPLKILFPSLQVVLVDALNKRVQYLAMACDSLGLEGVVCIHGRAEDLGHDTLYRERFDLCVSRAVSELPVLVEYCVPFVKIGGSFVAYKSKDVRKEVEMAENAASLLGARLKAVHEERIPETEILRTFVEYEKTGPTPDKYPRKSGKPSKKPL